MRYRWPIILHEMHMMSVSKKTLPYTSPIAALLCGVILAFQCACTPASTAIGASAKAGIALAEERPIKTLINDTAIMVEVNTRLLSASFKELFLTVNTIVFEGRVLLTGWVATNALRDQANEIVWTIDGVREVLNELNVGEGDSIADTARDKLITASLRSKILGDQNISGINYKIDTHDRVIYLIGVARTQDERDLVIAHAREVRYVRELVNYVLLIEDPRRSE